LNRHGGYQGERSEMLDFSVNINPLGMPPHLKYALEDALDGLGRYPEPDGRRHKKRLARRLGVADDWVILGNGGIELIYLYASAFSGGTAVIVVPTFNEYAEALSNAGWDLRLWQTDWDSRFRLDAEAFADYVCQTQPTAVFLCNPNNPTGVAYSPSYIKKLMDQCPDSVHWFIDESFVGFSSKASCFELVDGSRPVILLRSMTKFFGIPGLRLGYAVGHPKLISKMAGVQMPWSVNSLALTALDNLFEDQKYIDDTISYTQRERDRVRAALSKIPGLDVLPSSADFHLMRLQEGTAADLNALLETQKIYIRTCEDFVGLGDAYFRAAVKKKDENDRLIAALSAILTHQKA
jgi:threonine-phosphate decarboxylase